MPESVAPHQLIDPEALANDTLRLVEVPSPSGDEAAVAEVYAAMLDDAGLEVELDRTYPASPSVIGRSPGHVPQTALQLCGHLDTVHNDHAPGRITDGLVIGRGAADMKSGLAAIAHAVRALRSAGRLADTNLLVTAYGQHEEAVGDNALHAPLIDLLRRGIVGSGAIVAEGPHEYLPLAGRGLVIFEARFSGPPQSSHEVLGEWPAVRNPLRAALRFVNELDRRSASWDAVDELAGGESWFLGRVSGGDLYNRVPVEAVCEGTRRYPVGRQYVEVEAELADVVRQAAEDTNVDGRVRVIKSGQPFRLDSTEPVVRALQAAHVEVCGHQLPVGAIRYSADASQVIEYAGVPAVYHGVDSTTAHGDHEYVRIDDIVRCARVLTTAAQAFEAESERAPIGAWSPS